jgi:hypothetical protein
MKPEDQKPAVDIEKFLKQVRRQREQANELSAQIEMELVRFDGENAAIDFNVDWSHETVWATQRQMAELFGKDQNTIGEHLGNLYDSADFERSATTRKFRVVRLEGGRQVSREVEHYDLDVILTVGYRVNGDKAKAFRRWANGILKSYLLKGYALNEPHLRSNPQALRDLAAQVRALRSEEVTIYQAVRDCFMIAASDYDKAAPQVRTFYALLQDKFLYAITQKTASELILGRADADKPNMGVMACKGALPTKEEAKVGKNYLARDELYVLHILCEQFLLYAESKAMRGMSMTMAGLAKKLDQLLTTHEYPVFEGYDGRDFLKDRAMQHAEIEWKRLKALIKAGAHPSVDH